MKKAFLSLFAFITTLSLFAAPQAVVFDFGGVMIKETRRDLVITFLCQSLQLSPSEFETINSKKCQFLKEGKTEEVFWQEIAHQRGTPLSEGWSEEFKTVLKSAIRTNVDMYTLVQKLHEQNISTALFSNVDDWMAKMLKEFGFYQPFDSCVLSCEIGMKKPDPRAYNQLLEKLKLSAQEIVFIDDKAENVAAAQELGIDALLFESAEQVQQALQARGLLKPGN